MLCHLAVILHPPSLSPHGLGGLLRLASHGSTLSLPARMPPSLCLRISLGCRPAPLRQWLLLGPVTMEHSTRNRCPKWPVTLLSSPIRVSLPAFPLGNGAHEMAMMAVKASTLGPAEWVRRGFLLLCPSSSQPNRNRQHASHRHSFRYFSLPRGMRMKMDDSCHVGPAPYQNISENMDGWLLPGSDGLQRP
jgi:hypothetical protein